MKRRILSLHNLKSNVYAKRWGEAQEMRANYGENLRKTIRSVNSPRSRPNCGLHPLIHTFALVTMVLHVGTGEKRRECALKYEM